jgi:hypothetical protein
MAMRYLIVDDEAPSRANLRLAWPRIRTGSCLRMRQRRGRARGAGQNRTST